MGFFGNILELAKDLVIAPLAITKDILTLGGEVTDEESAVKNNLKNIAEDVQRIIDKE